MKNSSTTSSSRPAVPVFSNIILSEDHERRFNNINNTILAASLQTSVQKFQSNEKQSELRNAKHVLETKDTNTIKHFNEVIFTSNDTRSISEVTTFSTEPFNDYITQMSNVVTESTTEHTIINNQYIISMSVTEPEVEVITYIIEDVDEAITSNISNEHIDEDSITIQNFNEEINSNAAEVTVLSIEPFSEDINIEPEVTVLIVETIISNNVTGPVIEVVIEPDNEDTNIMTESEAEHVKEDIYSNVVTRNGHVAQDISNSEEVITSNVISEPIAAVITEPVNQTLISMTVTESEATISSESASGTIASSVLTESAAEVVVVTEPVIESITPNVSSSEVLLSAVIETTANFEQNSSAIPAGDVTNMHASEGEFLKTDVTTEVLAVVTIEGNINENTVDSSQFHENNIMLQNMLQYKGKKVVEQEEVNEINDNLDNHQQHEDKELLDPSIEYSPSKILKTELISNNDITPQASTKKGTESSIHDFDIAEFVAMDYDIDKIWESAKLKVEIEKEKAAALTVRDWAKKKRSLDALITETLKDYGEEYERAMTVKLAFEEDKRNWESKIRNMVFEKAQASSQYPTYNKPYYPQDEDPFQKNEMNSVFDRYGVVKKNTVSNDMDDKSPWHLTMDEWNMSQANLTKKNQIDVDFYCDTDEGETGLDEIKRNNSTHGNSLTNEFEAETPAKRKFSRFISPYKKK